MTNPIAVSTFIKAPIEHVWLIWTSPEHIVNWNFAADTWKCPNASNDVRTGGTFSWRMEAKDGSMGFDFNGTYSQIIPEQLLEYTLEDGRKVRVEMSETDAGTTVTELFEAENENPRELQQMGWQAILDNFGRYAESCLRVP